VSVVLSVILPREVDPFVLHGEKIKLLNKIENISKKQKCFLFLQLLNMVIIAKKILREFVLTHPDSDRGIEKWYTLTKAADWKSFTEMKSTFNSVDAVGNDRYVFNIKGNQYRLIALILFKVRTVFILFIDTHSEYDKLDASNVPYKK
jgi:mRNA interferase HigB